MLRLIPDWIIYLAIVVVMVWYAGRGEDKITVPAPAPELGEMLPSESPRDPQVIVTVDTPRSGVGTAFPADGRGRWMTARHVVDSCDEVGLRIDRRRFARVDSYQVPQNADLAILESGWEKDPFAADLTTPRQLGELGYFFGYPQGKPGEAVGTLLSRGRMSVRGRYRTDEPVLIWSEVARTRGLLGSLGGLSGGPVFDADGEVIGLVSAESPRRGRIYTVAPRSLRNHLSNETVEPVALDRERYAFAADQLRRERRVAQVACIKR